MSSEKVWQVIVTKRGEETKFDREEAEKLGGIVAAALDAFRDDYVVRLQDLRELYPTQDVPTETQSAPQVVLNKIGEPIHLTVKTTATGRVQYEISVHGSTSGAILAEVDKLDQAIFERYKDKLGRRGEGMSMQKGQLVYRDSGGDYPVLYIESLAEDLGKGVQVVYFMAAVKAGDTTVPRPVRASVELNQKRVLR